MTADYYFITTFLLGVACAGATIFRNPSKRVVVLRTVFAAVLVLPLLLLVPGRQRISCPLPEMPVRNAVFIEKIAVPIKSDILIAEPADHFVIESIAPSPEPPVASPAPGSGDDPVLNVYFVPFLLSGMFLVGIWQLLGLFRTRRLIRRSYPAEHDFYSPCKVRIHPKLASPVIVGLFRPTILLPETDDEKEIRSALAHENAHWENGDLYGLALERLLMFPLFFHPLFLILRRVIRHDRETLADLRAVQQVDRLDYVDQLLAWARRTSNRSLPCGALLLGIAEDPSRFPCSSNPFSRRIIMLLDKTVTLKKSSRRWRFTVFGILAAFALFAATLTFGGRFDVEPEEIALKNSLKEIAPTPTEKAAIKELRDLVWAEYRNSASPERSNEFPAPPPLEPVAEPNEEMISVECRMYSIPMPLAKVILADASLSWSALAVPEKAVSTETAGGETFHTDLKYNGQERAQPGYGTFATNTPLPLQVRLFEESNVRRFFNLFQSSPKANVLQAPKLTVCSGQLGTIEDVSRTPFVTNVLPVETEGIVFYEPFIQFFSEGMFVMTKATLLRDHSCRLDYCNITFSRIEKTENVKLLKQEQKTPGKSSGVSIQAPTVKTTSVTIPPIRIPKDMSLLVAVPGFLQDPNEDGVFFLVTLRRAYEDVSDSLHVLK